MQVNMEDRQTMEIQEQELFWLQDDSRNLQCTVLRHVTHLLSGMFSLLHTQSLFPHNLALLKKYNLHLAPQLPPSLHLFSFGFCP